MDRIFEALASTARRQILAYLSAGELSAGELAERFDFSKPALSSHLRILEEAGLIEREKRGQFVYFRQVPDRWPTRCSRGQPKSARSAARSSVKPAPAASPPPADPPRQGA